MTKIVRSLLGAAIAANLLGLLVVGVEPAHAQAICRTKCIGDEQACIKRTNNKGHCGGLASACIAKCK